MGALQVSKPFLSLSLISLLSLSLPPQDMGARQVSKPRKLLLHKSPTYLCKHPRHGVNFTGAAPCTPFYFLPRDSTSNLCALQSAKII